MRADSGPYHVTEVLDAVSGQLLAGSPRGSFRAITTDSRDIREGDLFVPLKGVTFDGHDFLIPALEAGARGSLVCRDINREIHQLPSESVLIQVRDTYQALSDLASSHRRIYPTPLIAVTGSSGKTTVKEMIAAVLGRSRHPLISEANFNNLIGLPMTVLKLQASHDVAVVEAGINMVGEMEILSRACAPDVALITTIGPVHLEGLGAIENVASEKLKLATSLKPGGAIVAPANDEYLVPLLAAAKGRIITFGMDEGDFRAQNIEQGEMVLFDMITPVGEARISMRISGYHNVRNALAAAAACHLVGADMDEIAKGLSDFRPFKWRMEVRSLNSGKKIIYDCYNANPQSVTEALKTLALMAKDRSCLAILGDMMELGDYSEDFHHEIGVLAAELGLDGVAYIGERRGAFERGFSSAKRGSGVLSLFEDKSQAWDGLKKSVSEYDIILVKGSRAMGMEEIADRIMEIS
jgi:UDP-N-acetylmuramoyl-tripeptide--D-alanyl-D-alanine ligase